MKDPACAVRFITVKQYAQATGYTFDNPGNTKDPSHPVDSINWFDAVKWCNARSQFEGRAPVYYTDAGFTTLYKTGQQLYLYVNPSADGWRLPTEAEWEKAARGGLTGKRFPWGDTIKNGPAASGGQANYYSDTSATGGGGFHYDLGPDGFNSAFNTGGLPYTSPVGSFPPNGYGLYDMAGNVYEWCWDWFSCSYYAPGQTDPQGPTTGSPGTGDLGSLRVIRGGSWSGPNANLARCARRVTTTSVSAIAGLRCVRRP